ncbi:hypothetical protein Sjap_007885 [Stephania japonica]|uniref:Uncharacterized protein n=1 Tax=Stephania japonica TaxID=461633 RepID=A0AAP0PDY8_9MAGN
MQVKVASVKQWVEKKSFWTDTKLRCTLLLLSRTKVLKIGDIIRETVHIEPKRERIEIRIRGECRSDSGFLRWPKLSSFKSSHTRPKHLQRSPSASIETFEEVLVGDNGELIKVMEPFPYSTADLHSIKYKNDEPAR